MVRQVENLTIKELFTEFFTQRGLIIGPSTSKFTSFFLPDGKTRIFLGTHGGIRKGTSISSSISLTDYYKGEKLEEIREKVREGRIRLKRAN